jgi:predicted dehydrogenase
MDPTPSRRDVMKKTAGAAAALGLGSLASCRGPRGGFTFVPTTAKSARSVYGANDRIRIAVLGPGGRAHRLMREVMNFADEAHAALVGVCDLWPARCDYAAHVIKETKGWEVATYPNTEALYAAKDIDAVIIATPDFSHAILCAEAVRNGKDVYVEKPLADVLEDAKLVRDVVKASNSVVQVGTQRRSDGKYIGAAEYVRSGSFGKVIAVEMHWNVNQSKRWRREDECAALAKDVADGKMDIHDAWKRYRLNRPDDPFTPRKYLEFRLFWPYSSGLADQWMSHQIDTVAWITGDPYPRGCVAGGGIYQWHDGRRNPDTFTAVFEYPSGFQVRWSGRQTNGCGGVNEVYYSNWGSLNFGLGKINGDGAPDEDKSPGSKALREMAIPTAGGIHHMLNWLQCIRTRQPPNADIDAGYCHSVAVAMAVKALHTGQRVTFDAATHTIRVA